MSNSKILFLKKILLISLFIFSMLLVIVNINSGAEAQSNTIELSTKSLDSAWEKRDLLSEQYRELALKRPALSNDYEVLWRVARAIYYAGFFVLPPKTTDTIKVEVFKYGMDAAEKAKNLQPNRVEGHYWYAVDAGGYGLAKGVMQALGGAKAMRESCDQVIKIDPSYFDYGAYRVRGRLFFKLPSIVSFGDKKKAIEDFKKAIELGAKTRLTYVYLAEAEESVFGKTQALQTLEKAKKQPDVVGIEEEKEIKREMDKLEKMWK